MIRIKIWLAAAGALVAAVLLAFWRGKSKQKESGYAETRKRMDEADRINGADAARKWLRDRGKR
jgi:dienelactone hydrolase